MLMMSAYHMSEQNLPEYARVLERFDPVAIHAYPTAIGYFARTALDMGIRYRGSSLKAVLTSSETLTEEHERSIRRFFGCPVYDWYGSLERVAAIGTCEAGNRHVIADYGLVEYHPLPDGSNEIVGTGFDNYLMPLLRYRIGDAVVPADPRYRCPCGRAFPVVERIIGRLDDCIQTPDGRHVSMVINVFDGLDYVREAQVVQNGVDSLVFRVVACRRMNEKDIADVKQRATRLVGSHMHVAVEESMSLPRTRNGKLKFVVKDLT
jgi:phenylacetate-CoA ligase